MAGQHVGIVHLVDVVAGEDDHVLGVVHIDEAQVLIDGVGGALVPGAALGALVGGQDMDAAGGAVQVPGLAAADIAVQLQGAVLGQHAHGVDAGVGAVGQGKVDDAVLAAKGDGGLCHIPGEDVQPAALAAGQQHRDTLFFHFSTSSFACFLILDFTGLGKTPSPRRNTAPKAGILMAAECSFPWEGMASTGTGSLSPNPSPP